MSTDLTKLTPVEREVLTIVVEEALNRMTVINKCSIEEVKIAIHSGNEIALNQFHQLVTKGLETATKTITKMNAVAAK